MKVQRTAPKAPARERYGGARLAAAAMGAAAAAGLASLHPEAADAPGLAGSQLHVGAALSGFYVGWRLIGLSFGRGWPWALFRGVTSGAAAAGLFCVLGGLHAAARSVSVMRFRDATELLFFAMQRSLDLVAAWAGSPVMPWTLAAGVAVSAAAEALHLHWAAPTAALGEAARGSPAPRRR